MADNNELKSTVQELETTMERQVALLKIIDELLGNCPVWMPVGYEDVHNNIILPLINVILSRMCRVMPSRSFLLHATCCLDWILKQREELKVKEHFLACVITGLMQLLPAVCEHLRQRGDPIDYMAADLKEINDKLQTHALSMSMGNLSMT